MSEPSKIHDPLLVTFVCTTNPDPRRHLIVGDNMCLLDWVPKPVVGIGMVNLIQDVAECLGIPGRGC